MANLPDTRTDRRTGSRDGSFLSRGEYPPELQAYWPSRIEEDRLWYSHYADAGEHFFAPADGHVYQVTNVRHGNDVFDLEPCAVATDLEAGFDSPTTTSNHLVDNICALAGAIEVGELVHLKSGALREIGDTVFLSVGQLAIQIGDTSADADALLEQIDTPRTNATDLAKIKPILSDANFDATLYAPPSTGVEEGPDQTPHRQQKPSGAQDVETHFIPVSPFSKWTFEDDSIRGWVENTFNEGETILNVCAGETELVAPPGGTILRNDANPDRKADFHVDVAELAALDELEAKSVDRIVFDPPWSLYQSNLRYQGEHVHQVSKEGTANIDLSKLPFDTPGPNEKTQIGHAAIAKRGFDHLLKPGGEILELTFHGTSMRNSMGYERQERVIFDPVGEARAVIGSRDKKTRQELTEFL